MHINLGSMSAGEMGDSLLLVRIRNQAVTNTFDGCVTSRSSANIHKRTVLTNIPIGSKADLQLLR